MIVTFSEGTRNTVGINISDSSDHDFVLGASDQVRILESMSIACGDAGASITVVLYDRDGNAFYIFNKEAVSANTTLLLNDTHYVLRKGGKITVKASAGAFSIIANMIDPPPVSAKNNVGIAQANR